MRSLTLKLIVAFAVVVGCSAASVCAGEPRIVKVGIGFNDQMPQYKALEVFKKEVEAASKGAYRVDLYHSSQLGDDREMMEALRLGNQEMTCPATAPVAGFVKEFRVLDLPYLFPSNEVMLKVLNGPAGQDLLKKLDGVGLHGLVYLPEGFRNLTNSRRVVATPADLKGLKIRTMENPIHLAAFRAWGANPTPMPFGEVFSAMEQKVVDGQENPTTVPYFAKFYEVQKYYSQTEHFAAPYILMISKKFWDGISPADRQMFEAAAQKTYAFHKELSAKSNTEILEKLKGLMTVTILTPDQKKQFFEAAQPAYAQVRKDLGDALVDSFLKAVQDASK